MAMHLSPRRRAYRSDAGFTLVEVLISVVILGIITVPLAGAVIAYARNTDATTDRLVLSHDAQISAAYFARDVAAVGMRDYSANGAPFVASIQLNAAYNAGGKTCGDATKPAATVRFLSDDWTNVGGTWTASTDIVAYYLLPAGEVSKLHRMACTTTGSTDIVVAHYVNPSTVTVNCSSTCDAAAVPLRVSLSFTMTKSVTNPSPSAYSVTLVGQRRQS